MTLQQKRIHEEIVTKLALKKRQICWTHLWGHPEYRTGRLLCLLARRRPAGLDGRQTEVPNLHREVVIVQENVVGLEVPKEDDIFPNFTDLIDIGNTCG